MSNDRIALVATALLFVLTLVGSGVWAEPANPLSSGASDPFAGSFAGDRLSATFAASGDGNYSGQVKLGDKTFPIQARLKGAALQGKFIAGADEFSFSATLSGRQLSFTTAQTTYTLQRVGEPANPPAAAGPANPLEGAAAPAPAASPQAAANDAAPLPDVPLPKGWSELGTTPSGRSIFCNFPNIQSIDDLIQHVGDAIGVMFGAKPQFGSACVDAKNKNGGIANFSATLQGTPIKGIVCFGVNPHGVSSATVIYTRPNTSHDEFMTLMQTVPAQPKMHTVQAPDGSGSIDIPEGWNLVSQSLTAGAIIVTGPKGEGVLVGARLILDTPDGLRVQTAKRAYDSSVNLYRMGGSRGPAPRPLESYFQYMSISPRLGPEEAFTKIISHSKMNEQLRNAGKVWPEYGEITATQKVPTMIAGNEAEAIGTTLRWHNGDKIGPWKRVMMKVETSKPDATGSWVIYFDQYLAPMETAAREFPLMLQIYNSINIPQAAVQRQLDKDNKAFQSICAYFQAQHEALLARGRQFQENQKEQFDRFEQQQAAQAQARHDACSDMIESSLGVRDVLDTATGEMTKVDLYNSTAITDTLNGLANDPNRFVQIPLRYER